MADYGIGKNHQIPHKLTKWNYQKVSHLIAHHKEHQFDPKFDKENVAKIQKQADGVEPSISRTRFPSLPMEKSIPLVILRMKFLSVCLPFVPQWVSSPRQRLHNRFISGDSWQLEWSDWLEKVVGRRGLLILTCPTTGRRSSLRRLPSSVLNLALGGSVLPTRLRVVRCGQNKSKQIGKQITETSKHKRNKIVLCLDSSLAGVELNSKNACVKLCVPRNCSLRTNIWRNEPEVKCSNLERGAVSFKVVRLLISSEFTQKITHFK